jgi:hypothetical protein
MKRPVLTALLLAVTIPASVPLQAQGGASGQQTGQGAQGRGQGGAGGQGGQGRMPARAQRNVDPNAPKGTGVMKGQIVGAESGAPIRRAQVRVTSAEARESRLATTDQQGRFEIRDLAAGHYTMTASKGGYVSLQYGQRRPTEPGTPIDLSDGQSIDRLVIALPKGSVIGGRVTDEYGEPVANARVVAMRYGYANGARRLLPAAGSNISDTTDDLGQYRLFGLPPGDYVISATLRAGAAEVTDPAGAELSGYAPTYFPGTPNVTEAQRVTVGVSQENTSVSFGLVATKLVRIAGQVMSSTGGAAGGGVVTLMPATGAAGRGALLLQGGAGRVDQTGTFRINGVAPGRYQLQAQTGQRGAGEFAKMDIAIGAEDVDGLVLVTSPGARVSGTVVTDTGQPPSFRPQQVQVIARPSNPDSTVGGFGGGPGGGPGGGGFFGGGPGGNGRLGDDFSFEIGNIVEPRLFRVNAPQGWALKSVSLNGQDITDVPMEFPGGQNVTGLQVVLTQKQTDVSGTITNARNEPIIDATVVVFPASDALWMYQSRFIKAARPDQQGTFRVAGLPPHDDYLIVAVQSLEDGQAGDPDFLASVKNAASHLSLSEGESKTVTLSLSARK